MTHPLAILTPIADWLALTCVALVPLMAMHLAQAEEVVARDRAVLELEIAEQREQIEFHEEFLVNCLSGRTMVVGKVAGVMCIPL